MGLAPFVGRAGELARLNDELQGARDGARVLLVLGDAGVGKTRLLAEFRELARPRARFLIGRGSPLGSSIPFSIVVEALESHLRTLSVEALATLCGPQLMALRDVLPSVARATAIDGAQSPGRIAVFEAFVLVLEALARERPLVLVLDDAHRADPSTWELVHYLARNAPRAPLLLTAVVREATAERREDLDATITTLLKDGLASDLRLAPLEPADVDALAVRTLGPARMRPALGEWLYERTQGNALFATALLDDLATDPERRAVPRTIRAHVEALSAGLEATGREVLATAAVLGHTFSLRTIARIIPADAGHWLDELVRRGILHERDRDGDAAYDFGHPLVQEVVYESIGAARRRELHEQLSRTLADEPLAVRAYHAARGALPGDSAAIALIWDAARAAERAQTHREALLHLSALRRLIPPASPDRAAVLDEIGWQAAEGGEHQSGIDALRELLPLRAEARERAVVHMRLSSLLSAGPAELAEAEREARAAVRDFTEAGAAEQLASALNELAWIQGEIGDVAAQVAGSRDALARAEALGDETLVLHALGSLGYAYPGLGEADAAADALRRGQAIAARRGDHAQYAWHTGALGLALTYAGRLDEATRVLDALLDDGPSPSAIPYVNRAYLNWYVGRWSEALDDHRAVEAMHPTTVPAYAAWCATVAGLIEIAMKRDASGERHLEQGGRFYTQADFYYQSAVNDWAIGSARALQGDARSAVTRMARAAARTREMGVIAVESFVLPDLAAAYVECGELDAADDAAARARAIATTLGTTLASAFASYAEGVAAKARGRSGAARDALRTAADVASSVGAKILEARSLAQLSGASEGAARVKHGTDAARIFAALGDQREEERILAELRRASPAGRKSAQMVGELTAREREVVALARTGLANRDIAERMHVSERTVETHLAHIYSKLGVAGRRELTRG